MKKFVFPFGSLPWSTKFNLPERFSTPGLKPVQVVAVAQNVSAASFVRDVAELMRRDEASHHLDARFEEIVYDMRPGDWLLRYEHQDGIGIALFRLPNQIIHRIDLPCLELSTSPVAA